MAKTDFRQIVFIDARVPDIGDLLSGLQPDEQAFVLDPGSDGLQQIADILADNNLTDLSSISIVGHGALRSRRRSSADQVPRGSAVGDRPAEVHAARLCR